MKERQEIDRWLDEALRDYADVHPRPGLENRTLSRLTAEAPAPGRSINWWALAVGLAVLGSFVVVWLRPALEPVPAPKMRWTAQVPTPSQIQPVSLPRAAELSHRVAARVRRAMPAKRERFPSPSPLSEQEKMLARFVRDFPQRAAMVAQLQTELYKQDRKEMARPWPPKENN
jgi:hypothetical protein